MTALALRWLWHALALRADIVVGVAVVGRAG